MAKFLITGGMGAIGSNLTNYLCQNNHQVDVIDNLSSPTVNILNKNAIFYKKNIEDINFIRDLFRKNEYNYIIHAAAFFANQRSVEFPEQDLITNGLGLVNILQNCNQTTIKKIIFLSSSCVYENKFYEDSIFSNSLSTPYAITKKLGEDYFKYFAKKFKKNYLILRLFNNYGPGELHGQYRNVIPNFFYQAIKNKNIKITGTGLETRDFNYINDTINYIINLTFDKKLSNETFNIGSGKSYKIIDIANKIINICNSDSKIQYHKIRKWDTVTNRRASIRKLKKFNIYFKPTDINYGLSETYKWIKDKV